MRIPSGCAISALISKNGNRMSGETIMKSMVPMHDRSNGLGGGFAGYGIYPEYKEFYAFHIFYNDNEARVRCERLLKDRFEIVKAENVPIRKIPEITDIPLIWRYFVAPLSSVLSRLQLDEKEYVARTVMTINAKSEGAYVFSSGKNMGTFKAVGFPEDVGRFYRLEEYEATPGRRTAVTPPIPPAGGAGRTPLRCWIILLYITVKFPPTMRTAATLKCLVTNVPCKPIPRLLPTLPIIYCGGRA